MPKKAAVKPAPEPVTLAIVWGEPEPIEVPVSAIVYDSGVFRSPNENQIALGQLHCLTTGTLSSDFIPTVSLRWDGRYVFHGLTSNS